MNRVLFLCTGNSCRSQMAEALWETHARGAWRAVSAGSRPCGYVHPLAIRAMQELDLDLSEHRSKSLDQYVDEPFDLVITVCDNAQNDCPNFGRCEKMLHWPFEDPADATGTEDEQLMFFRRVRDEISGKIEGYLEHA